MLKTQNNAITDISHVKSLTDGLIGTVKSWEDLEKIIQSGRFHLLGRTPVEQTRYMAESAKLAEQHGSVSNHVQKLLGKEKPKDGFILRENDFPYALEPGIAHYILWSTESLPSGNAPTPTVHKYVEKHFGSFADYLWLVNPPHLRSIPSIYHGHLFIRKNSCSLTPELGNRYTNQTKPNQTNN